MKKVFENIRKFTSNKIVRRVLRYTGDVIIGVLIVLLGLSIYDNIQSKGRNWALPTIGSYRWLTVLSGSMKPTFNPGDLIVDKKADPSKLKVGDVVTYMFGDNVLSTHRITKINKDNKGNLTFNTKGDNNNAADETPVQAKMVAGRYLFRIPYLGFVMQKLKGILGIILIWILFLYVLGTEIYRISKESKKQGNEKTVVQ